MSNVRTIFANMSWMMISQIITSACAFVWTLILARYLGVTNFGIFGTAVSFSTIFGIFADFGINAYIVRAIATDFDNEPKYMGVAISVKVLLSVLYMLMVFLALLVLGWDNYVVAICLLFALENAIKTCYGLLFASFQAHEKMKYQAISNTILNILTFIFIIVITFTNWELFGIAFAYILANIIAAIYTVLALKHNIFAPKFIFDKDFSIKLIKAGIPFALTSFFYTIYFSIDMVMLQQFSGAYPTGLYNSTYKLINVLTLFYTIYTAVIFPVMSKLFKSGEDLLQLSFNKSVKYLSLITIPLSIATVYYASDIINIVYGNQYAQADSVLQILIWTVIFLFVNGACSLVLNASHKEVAVTKIYSIAALFNVILNLILIPNYNVFGASVATVLSEILILVLELYALSRINQLPDKHLIFDILKISIASILLGIFLYYANLSLWVAIPVSIVVYLILTVILRAYDDTDILIVKQILGR